HWQDDAAVHYMMSHAPRPCIQRMWLPEQCLKTSGNGNAPGIIRNLARPWTKLFTGSRLQRASLLACLMAPHWAKSSCGAKTSRDSDVGSIPIGLKSWGPGWVATVCRARLTE